jgi:hypothetical protein
MQIFYQMQECSQKNLQEQIPSLNDFHVIEKKQVRNPTVAGLDSGPWGQLGHEEFQPKLWQRWLFSMHANNHERHIHQRESRFGMRLLDREYAVSFLGVATRRLHA